MKRMLLMMVACLMGHAAMQAQYFCADKGTELSYVIYDEAGQSMANETVTVKKVQERDGVTSVEYFAKIVDNKTKDDTSYTIYNWTYDGGQSVCTEDLMYGPFVDSDANPTLYNVEIREALMHDKKFKGDNSLVLGDDLKAGMTLPDRFYAWQDGLKGVRKNEVTITGGACLGEEVVSTTGGKFQCLKISYLKRTKVALKAKTVRVTEWYAAGIGLVKSESFDLKGRSAGKVLLVKVRKG